jgi:redox-sensitive bicupin YhaK (pirin superfamily)
MFTLRPAAERGHFDHGWLDTYHTFSFGDYRDSQHVQFRVLRVMNEDRVAPGQGFGMHPHADMEIITYVLAGKLEHRDSLDNGAVITPGEVQVMSAGTGIMHSEFNPSADEPVHLYQVWIRPAERGASPRYDQRRFADELLHNQLQVVVSGDGRGDSLTIGQDAAMLVGRLDAGVEVDYELAAGRHAWLQVATGQLQCGAQPLKAGDGLAISDETQLKIAATSRCELLLFDLP